ncbi:hypothetical protein WA026_007843 [Henosepilachna vigintioctopunctata]|uniref:UPAR/Ly6 domain-containing protein n=1 Tax=Henosepilachna vigintioctopunctata TaxID=420089 RepID=A0AAW1U465_9CUCU
MMYKSIIIIVFLSFAAYVSSLNCLSCNNENACLNSPSKRCGPKADTCFSSVVQNLLHPMVKSNTIEVVLMKRMFVKQYWNGISEGVISVIQITATTTRSNTSGQT